MAISKPTLPPIKGHVEVEVNGVRQYMPPLNPSTSAEAPEAEPQAPTAEQVLAVLLGGGEQDG